MKEELERAVSAPPAISVIVPVYNAEKYLQRCVDSILSQTFTDFELLLIDDGSKDKSGAICDEYAAKDSRVRVFHKENGGVSSARNLGLDNVKGEWISFIDADDKVKETLCEVLHTYFLRYCQCDILRYGYEHRMPSGCTVTNLSKEYRLTDKEEIIKICDSVCYFEMIWNAAFRAELVRDIRFDTSIDWSEDYLFMYKCISKSREVYIINKVLYHYYDTPNSLRTRVESLRRRIDIIGLNIREKCNLMSTPEIIEENLSNFSNMLSSLVSWFYKDSQYSYVERKDARNALGNICSGAKKGLILKLFEKFYPFFLVDFLFLCYFRYIKK